MFSFGRNIKFSRPLEGCVRPLRARKQQQRDRVRGTNKDLSCGWHRWTLNADLPRVGQAISVNGCMRPYCIREPVWPKLPRIPTRGASRRRQDKDQHTICFGYAVD